MRVPSEGRGWNSLALYLPLADKRRQEFSRHWRRAARGEPEWTALPATGRATPLLEARIGGNLQLQVGVASPSTSPDGRPTLDLLCRLKSGSCRPGRHEREQARIGHLTRHHARG